MLEQPGMDLPDAILQKGQVAILVGQVGVDARNLAGEPLAVLKRNKPIVPPMPQLYRDAGGVKCKTPWLQMRLAVVPPTLIARRQTHLTRRPEVLAQLRGECSGVHRRKQGWKRVGHVLGTQRQQPLTVIDALRPSGRFVGEHELDVVDVLRAHACEVIKPRRTVRGDRGERSYRHDQVWQKSCARKRVRPSPRYPPDSEPVDAQHTGNLSNVGRAVGDRPARVRSGPAVARPVIADQPYSAVGGVGDVRAIQDTCAGCAVVHEDRLAVGVARLLDPQDPAIGALDQSFQELFKRIPVLRSATRTNSALDVVAEP